MYTRGSHLISISLLLLLFHTNALGLAIKFGNGYQFNGLNSTNSIDLLDVCITKLSLNRHW